jgi:serine/threonine protein kinase
MEQLYKQRIDKYYYIEEILKEFSSLCIKRDSKNTRFIYDTKKDTSIIKLNSILGTPEKSKDGESWKATVLDKKKETSIAVKIIPIKNLEFNKREIKIMDILKKVVLNKGTPNFNLMYDNFICNHNKKYIFESRLIQDKINELNKMVEFNNSLEKIEKNIAEYEPNVYEVFIENYNLLKKTIGNITGELTEKITSLKDYPVKSLIILNELADTDLATHINSYTSFDDDIEDIQNIIYQILFGLLTMNYQGIAHLDLHAGNIFINKLNKKIDIFYKYKNFSHKINTKNFIKISDFGRSWYFETIEVNDKICHQIYKELSRFFPIYFIIDDLKTKEIFTKNIKKIGPKFFHVYDFWRIFKNIIISLEKILNIKLKNTDNTILKKIILIITGFEKHIVSLITDKIDNVIYEIYNKNIEDIIYFIEVKEQPKFYFKVA